MDKHDYKTKKWRSILFRLPFLLLIPAGLLLPRFAMRHMDWIERVYMARIYPVLKGAISAATSLVPFSIAEILLYTVCLILPVWLIIRLIRSFTRGEWQRLVSLILSLCIIAGLMLNLFYALWGLAYFRQPLKNRMGLPSPDYSPETLCALTVSLAEKASVVRETIPEDASGVFVLPDGAEAAFLSIIPAYASLSEAMPIFSGKVTSAKPVLLSRALSWAGIAGIYIGFTAEPNVNTDQTALLIPAGAAHEMAHQLGIASENEAEFVSFLACTHASDPSVHYSGLMNALISCGNALYRTDSALFAEASAHYSDGMRRDLAVYNAYWDAFAGPVEEQATAINDNYLKHNQQDSGVASYGEVVDLLLSWYALQSEKPEP